MGYYSDVCIKCEKAAFRKILSAAKEYDFMPKVKVDTLENYYLTWDLIKWYEELDDVAAILKELDYLDEVYGEGSGCHGYSYKMIRIGENNDDVEERTNDCDYEFNCVRTFDIPDDYCADVNIS